MFGKGANYGRVISWGRRCYAIEVRRGGDASLRQGIRANVPCQRRCTPLSLRPAIDAQHFHKSGYFFQMPQRQAHGGVVAAPKINKEAVLPRLAAYRTRLDPAQVQIT